MLAMIITSMTMRATITTDMTMTTTTDKKRSMMKRTMLSTQLI